MWQFVIGQQIAVHRFAEEFVAYNHCSGDTYLLAPAAGHILQSLQGAPADTLTLAKSFAFLWQRDLDSELTTQMAHILAELESLALIEMAPS